MSNGDLYSLVQRLVSISRDRGNLFSAADTIELLGKLIAEYSAHVRSLLWTAKLEGDEGLAMKGFKDTSESWEASLTRARARADSQDGDMARDGQLNQVPPRKGGPLLGNRQYPGLGAGAHKPVDGDGGSIEQGIRGLETPDATMGPGRRPGRSEDTMRA